MPFIKIWVHLVWSTKKRKPVLTKNIREKLFVHIKENGKRKNIHIDFINGYIDHLHVLVSLKPEQTIAEIVQLIKGESSYWINKNDFCQQRFKWQSEYFAASVSESGIDAVREYIKNQEEHHRKKTFQEEYNEFMNKYGFDLMKG